MSVELDTVMVGERKSMRAALMQRQVMVMPVR